MQCSSFECVQLKDLRKGATTRARALNQIAAATQRLEKVQSLLRLLGDTDEELAVSNRFHRASRRLHLVGMDTPTSRIYGELTLAFHDLNFILSDSFYPG